MERAEALEIAKDKYAEYKKADIDHMFGRREEFDAFEEFGYKNGWVYVGKFCFSAEEITGEQYDIAQGGWAYL